MRIEGDAPEAQIAWDIVRRGLMVAPFAVGLVWLVADRPNALSVGFGIGIVLANLLLSAYLLRWAARISLGLVASVSIGGYVMRLALIFLAVWFVKDMAWVRMLPLGLAIIATHLGLLVWELRYVSGTYAHPGLKPSTRRPAAGYRGQWQQAVNARHEDQKKRNKIERASGRAGSNRIERVSGEKATEAT